MLVADLAYLAAAPVALPLLWLKSLRTGKYRTGLAGRFGAGAEVLSRRPAGCRVLLLHCVSVGELNSVTTLIGRLLAADEKLHVAVSTTTDTGWARACALFSTDGGGETPRVHAVRFPFDFSFAVEHLFDRVRPDAAALVELETWPNFLAIAQSRRIPVAIINGRISEKSFPRYQAVRPLMGSMLRKLAWIGAQTPAIAARFRALGAEDSGVETIPTLKYDNAQIGERVAGQEALAAAAGLKAEQRLFVAGSTGPGEEEILLDAYQGLRGRFPGLRLAIAPRHPEVVAQVARAIEARGMEAIFRSERSDGTAGAPLEGRQVLLLNTMGELRKLYALAFAVFVGRSFFKKGGGGSDMIEVAALGRPCCFGPFTSNFAEVAELLLAEGVAARVDGAGDLAGVLELWLKDPGAAQGSGARARELIRGQQGSTQRYVEKLLALLPAKSEM